MLNFITVCLAIIRSATIAIALLHGAVAHASSGIATKPWPAPVGHRQPRVADIPASTSASQHIIDQEDADVDRKISSICRGC
jgi:hypothetical protein